MPEENSDVTVGGELFIYIYIDIIVASILATG